MDFALIETLRWEPAEGFLRLAFHLARMEASAAALGFSFDRAAAHSELRKAATANEALRVRLELSRDGGLGVNATPFMPMPPNTIWHVAIASARLDPGNSLLRHKTTRRDVYTAARAEYSAESVDEVIMLNVNGDVCEGTITNIFMRQEPGGQLLTPPLSCGLLPGVLRRELLETGEAREQALTPGDLAQAFELYCGNSLRELIPAVLS